MHDAGYMGTKFIMKMGKIDVDSYPCQHLWL